MLPEFLQSTYNQYKADINAFVIWLLETANHCGYQPALCAATSTTTKGKRKAKNDGSVADPLHYSVTTKDLRKFAEVVASATVTVPQSVLTTAKRAIKLRKEMTS